MKNIKNDLWESHDYEKNHEIYYHNIKSDLLLIAFYSHYKHVVVCTKKNTSE